MERIFCDVCQAVIKPGTALEHEKHPVTYPFLRVGTVDENGHFHESSKRKPLKFAFTKGDQVRYLGTYEETMKGNELDGKITDLRWIFNGPEYKVKHSPRKSYWLPERLLEKVSA
jgi:hypothetical protein